MDKNMTGRRITAPKGLEKIAALRHLAAGDYSIVIIPSYE
jgi:hypothetical protein